MSSRKALTGKALKKKTHTKQHENACVFAGSAGTHLPLLLSGLVLERCWTCLGKKKSIPGVSPALLRAVAHSLRASELLDGAGPFPELFHCTGTEMPASSRSQEKAPRLVWLCCCGQNCIPQVLGGERGARRALLEPRSGKHGTPLPLVYPGGSRGLFHGAGGVSMLAARWQPDRIDSGISEGAPRGLFWL